MRPALATAVWLLPTVLAVPVAQGARATERLTARGLVRPLAEATISSETPGRVIELPFREGQRFAAGDVLIRLDCSGIEAAAASARADLAAARSQLDATSEMQRLKAAGQRDLEQAEARRDKAAADLEGIAVRLRSCVIRAPFSGAVVERPVNLHEVVAPNTPLMRIVDGERLEIELIVPSDWLGWLAPGRPVAFCIDETGRCLPATIVRLGGAVDPVSQTAKAFAAFAGEHERVLPGMSGSATVDPPER